MHLKQTNARVAPLWTWLFAIAMMAFNCAMSMAQTTVGLHGTVLDDTGQPAIGATVQVDGSTAKTVTDIDGHFTLNITDKKAPYTVRVTYVGMEPAVTTVRNTNQQIAISLKAEAHQLENVVVTGYRTMTKHNVAGSVAVLTDKEFAGKVPTSIDNLLQGLVAGVAVSNQGQPGSSSKIRIRGINTMEGSAEPLWIVDGVPLQDDLPAITSTQIQNGDLSDLFVNGISGINPNDIENVTILKDASAAAIYGSRAAGGVIVVTTKHGQAGKMKVSYSTNLISQLKPQRDGDLMNSSEKLAWEQELWDEFSAKPFAAGASHVPVIGIVGMLRSGKLGKNNILQGSNGYEAMTTAEQDAYINELAGHSTNWFNTIFRNTFSQNHTVSVSGGSEQATYYASLGMTRQNGVLKESDYRRYNMNMSLNLKPTKKLRIQLNVKYAQEESAEPAPYVSPFTYAYFANPYERPYNADGSYRPDITYFNLASMNDGSKDSPILPVSGFNILKEMELTNKAADKNSVTGSLRATYKIIDGLSVEGLVSYSHNNNNSSTVIDKNSLAAFNDRLWFDEDVLSWNPYGSITQSASKGYSYNTRLQLNYHKVFAKIHDFSVYGGAELRGSHTKRFYAKQYGYDPKTQTTVWPTNPNPSTDDSERYKSLIENLMGRSEVQNRYASFYVAGDYVLMDRYVANFSFRTDGSNNFGSDEQFNPTYSAGIGWHVHEESFMKPLRKIISRLSLRASGGYTGNVVPGVDKKLVLTIGTNTWNGINTARIKSAPNPKLRWEKTRDAKIAADMGLFNNRLNAIVEAYYRLSTDVITAAYLTSTTGFTSLKYNSSDIVNKGIELTLSGTPLKGKDFSLDLSANFAYNYNYLKKFRSTTGGISNGRYENYPISSVFTAKVTGIDPYSGYYDYQLRPDAQLSSESSLKAMSNYRYFRGTSNHPYSGGFSVRANYRNFFLNVSGAYSWGGLISTLINSPATYTAVSSRFNEVPQTVYSDLYRNFLNVRRDMTDRWTTAHTTGVKYPRIIDALGDDLGLEDTNPTQGNASDIVQGTYLQKVSYLKIRDITFGYTLPAAIASKIGLNNLGMSVSMNNFFTFTNYDGLDPENPGATYPTTRSVSFNLNLGF